MSRKANVKEFADRINSVEEYYFSAKLRELINDRRRKSMWVNAGNRKPDVIFRIDSVIELFVALADNQKAHGYPNYQGIPDIRNAMAEFYAEEYGVKTQFQQKNPPTDGL